MKPTRAVRVILLASFLLVMSAGVVQLLAESFDSPTEQIDPNAAAEPEVRYEGWLSVNYGDPPPDSGVPGERIVELVDANGSRLIALVMAEGLIQEYFGQYIAVTGILRAPIDAFEQRSSGDLILNVTSAVPAAQTRSQGLPNLRLVSGSQSWVNLLCKFNDVATEPHPPSFYDGFYAAAYPSLDDYWRQVSYNNINLLGSEVMSAWRTMPSARSAYFNANGSANLTKLRTDCLAIWDADVDFPEFVGINFFFNDTLDCCAWGGSAFITIDSQSQIYRTTYLPPWAANHAVIAHEMGHGYGFPHSTGPANDPPSELSIYVSQWDTMSDSNGTCAVASASLGCLAQGTISYNLRNAEWIPGNLIATIGAGQADTFDLERTVLPNTGGDYQMAVVPIGTSTSRYYTVEVRNIDAGYDQNIPASAVIIHSVNTGRSGNGGAAYVIDADTGNSNTNDAGARWLVGETFTDAANNITIGVVSQSGSRFTVTITNNSVNVPVVSNDLFANALVVNPNNTYTQEWELATNSTSDPVPVCGVFGRTVWYRLTPTASGSITIDTNGTVGVNAVDTVLGVYTGTSGNLTQAACDDDNGDGNLSSVTLNVQQGTTYYIVVGSYSNIPVSPFSILKLNLSAITAFTPTNTATNTPTRTSTRTPTRTNTVTPSRTPTQTLTRTNTATVTRTPTRTNTVVGTPTRTNTATRTPTRTPSRTPTRTPSATNTGAPSGNLLHNGNFSSPIGSASGNWGIFPDNVQFPNQIVGGVFQFYGNTPGGVVLQQSGTALASGTGIEVLLDLGNNSNVRKRATVIAWDADFDDLRVCTFWLAPNSPLQTYYMLFRTAQAWSNATLSIYASSADGVGWYRMDNAVMRITPSVTDNRTYCYDPDVPTPTGGADCPNLISNGGFNAPITNGIGNWGIYPQNGDVVSQITAGVFEYRRIPGAEAGVVLEDTLQGVPQGSIMEATFRLGNTTPTQQRVTILIRTRDFADLQVCSFWLQPGAPLATYVIRTYNILPWTNSGGIDHTVGISFYASTTANSGWLRLDDVTLKVRPSLNIIGTECYTPGTAPADVLLPTDEELNIGVLPVPATLTPEPTATLQMILPEPVLEITSTPPPDIDPNEGGVSEGG